MSRSRVGRVLGTGLAIGFAASVVMSVPATAKPIDRGSDVVETTFTDTNFCDAGVTVEVNGVEEVEYRFNARKPGTAPYWHANVWAHWTYENLDGDVVRETTRLVDKDLAITDNGDGTLTILVLATGNTTIFDESGTAIARNPGQVRYEVLIDHNGTPEDPSDDEFLEFLGLVKESTGRTDDFCAAVLPVLG
ncbi:hypothetical protein [Agromyces tropicus]